MKTTPALLTTVILLTATAAIAADFQPVTCEGTYPPTHTIFKASARTTRTRSSGHSLRSWKTDRSGKVVKQVDVANHHGDLCFHKGKVYIALNLGKFNDPKGNADSWIYVYDAGDISFLAKHKTPEVFHGAGGIAFYNGKFLIVGGLPDEVKENFVDEYDTDFRL